MSLAVDIQDTEVPLVNPLSRWVKVGASLLLCVTIFLGVREYFQLHNQPLDISRAQVIAFPFFVFFVYGFGSLFVTLSRLCLAVIALLGLLAGGYAYNYHLFSGDSIIMATLDGDAYASDTRVIRKQIEIVSKKIGSLPITPYYTTIRSEDAANTLLNDDERTQAVIWGNKRWITVTLDENSQETDLHPYAQPWLKEFAGLKIVKNTDSFGLSTNPVIDTAYFISWVLKGTTDSLENASQMEAAWTTYAHRAFAYLLLGNQYLKEAIAADRYEYASFDCALEAYQVGFNIIADKGDSELKTAFLNNLGIVSYLQGTFESDKTARLKGKNLLYTAGRQDQGAVGEKYSLSSSKIARENIEFFKLLHNKKKIYG